jgi:hypothetical protein
MLWYYTIDVVPANIMSSYVCLTKIDITILWNTQTSMLYYGYAWTQEAGS